ncbi:aldo/keto reductase [Arthrobacter sp. ISL-95]|uniref:aldo/keto reductase n=1 Tax=Arthrobacter sp. ISL-95 TaxID=2819116 RepID=UPI0037C0A8FE
MRFADRALPSSGQRSTALGFGTMELRGASHRGPRLLDEIVAELLLSTDLDEGIAFIDTSIDYGESEELIGRHVSRRRSEYLLASNVGCLWTTSQMARPTALWSMTIRPLISVQESSKPLASSHRLSGPGAGPHSALCGGSST